MNSTTIDTLLRPRNFLFAFLLFGLVMWTLLPCLVYRVLPLDAAEAVAWGASFSLGTSKHPPLSGWIAYGSSALFGHADFGIFLLSQLCVACGFFYVYRLAREFYDETGAVMAALLIGFYYYYNFESVKYNANLPHMALLPMNAYYFYRGLKTGRLLDWLLCGVTAAAAFYSKYFSLTLLAGMFCYMLCNKDARASFAKTGPYLAGAVFLLLVSPHLHWLYQNDFPPFSYVSGELKKTSVLFAVGKTVLVLLFPVSVMALAAFCTQAIARRSWRLTVPVVYNKKAVVYAAFLLAAPSLSLLTIACTGHAIVSEWSFQIFFFCGIFLIGFFPEPQDRHTFRVFAGLFLMVSILIMCIYIGYNLTSSKERRHLNIAEVARFGDDFYRNSVGAAPQLIAGEMWTVAALQRAHGYKIDAYMTNNPSALPGLREKFKSGALLVAPSRRQLEEFAEKDLQCNLDGRIIEHDFKFKAPLGKEKIQRLYFSVIKPGEAKQ